MKTLLSVREAADLLQMTPSGVYAAIKRGDIPAKRTNGRLTVKRADVRRYERELVRFLNESDPNRPLTDDEFLQCLWDSDPD
jgi:excisionase family DNA binding protein